MRFRLIYPLILGTILICLAPSDAVDVGAHSHGIHPNFAPISLGMKFPSSPMVVHYDPIGSHMMNYQIGMATPQSTSLYYFGRDFSLGTLDSNYPGTPYLTQFLADP